MQYLIKIDKDSIKKNPDAGQTSFIVPGMITYNSDGGIERPISIVHSLTPVPNYSAFYLDTEIECKFCLAKFNYTELKDDSEDYYDENIAIENICPKCSESNCCEIDFEQFDNMTGKTNK